MTRADAIRFTKKIKLGPMFNGSSCWLWTAGTVHNGYGQFRVGLSHQYAHRVSWQAKHGAIPNRLQIDHLCRNRACVNPSHLELVTNRQNALRGVGFAAINALKTRCPSGHDYSGRNLGIGRRGQRYCKTCIRIKSSRRRAANRLPK